MPRGGVKNVLGQVGAVQLDTISVLARSHELVCYARYGPAGRTAVEAALWGGGAFEYWAHAACVLPIADWPLFEWRRSSWRKKAEETTVPASVLSDLRSRLDEGPATASELGGAKGGGPWWDWTHAKRGVELMLATGEVVCVSRRGFQRVYDLAERCIPDDLLASSPGVTECHVRLVEASARHLGVATAGDLSDYYRLKRNDVLAVIGDTCLVEVEVRGWKDRTWAHPDVLGHTEESGTGRQRTTLLSPFDSLVWDRARAERVFGFSHRLEAYVPAAKRVHGYYSMALLSGGRIVGKVDPARRDGAFVAKRVTIDSVGAVAAAATAISRAARWVRATDVIIETVEPHDARATLSRYFA